ncbi:hypothetical protein RUM44_008000 [Polyplax serrata]|uniref:Uncharacterized protein n=1 Tax=Polyplax serrata TaxID=468196 RepID=A0ABR1B7I6_POLSC
MCPAWSPGVRSQSGPSERQQLEAVNQTWNENMKQEKLSGNSRPDLMDEPLRALKQFVAEEPATMAASHDDKVDRSRLLA